MEQKKNYTLPIIMMFALFFMISFVTGLQNPMGVIVKDQFGASNLLSQLGNFANFIAYAFMGIPAGLMLKRIGYKKTALAAVVVGFLGVAVQYLSGVTESFTVYLIGAFIAGFSMCMLNTVVNPMLNTLGGGGNKGNQLIQFGGSVNSMGATIVPVLGGYLMGSSKTIAAAAPALYLAMGIFALTFIVLYFTHIPEPFVSTKESKKDGHSALSFRHFILGAVGIFIYVGVEVGIPNIGNLYMTADPSTGGLGISEAVAGTVVGAYWLLMLCGRFIGGMVGAKVSSRAMLIFVSSLGVILIMLAMFLPAVGVMMPAFDQDTLSFTLTEVPVNVVMLVLCGFCTSVMWGGIFNLAVEGLGKYTSMGAGFFMVMVCGGGVLPAIQGGIADSFGFMNSYWVIVAGMIYLLYYAIAGSKNVNKNIPVNE
ncbi:MAG: MFS transporter [Alistipes sp.]